MKKTLVSALTTALVVGAASTTFAAANPFADVPSDHWAYDAVSTLAADGVIEGYGDNTFKGDRNITRYEMAQMIAKAMAKTNVGSNDKALIDKLAAEFADELNNLGVRVANLEKNADKVKWNGEARYTYKSAHNHPAYSESSKSNSDKVLLRLEPTAEVNDHWAVKARLDAQTNLKKDTGDDGNVKLKRVWAQGNYGALTFKLGKVPTTVDNDLILDGQFSGGQLDCDYAEKLKLKVSLGAGRFNLANATSDAITKANTYIKKNFDEDVSAANYQFIGLTYLPSDKLSVGAAFHHFESKAFAVTDFAEYINNGNVVKDANIYSLRAAYKFDNNWKIDAVWADNTKSSDFALVSNNVKRIDTGDQRYAYRSQLTYKGAQKANKGTWGAWVAYAHLGQFAAINPTYDAMLPGEKGWEIGANYTVFPNVVATVRYADTDNIIEVNNKEYSSVKHIFGRVQFFF